MLKFMLCFVWVYLGLMFFNFVIRYFIFGFIVLLLLDDFLNKENICLNIVLLDLKLCFIGNLYIYKNFYIMKYGCFNLWGLFILLVI